MRVKKGLVAEFKGELVGVTALDVTEREIIKAVAAEIQFAVHMLRRGGNDEQSIKKLFVEIVANGLVNDDRVEK